MRSDDQSINQDKTIAGKRSAGDPQSLGDQKTLHTHGSDLSGLPRFQAPEYAQRYEILSVIGSGGMGQVLLALDTKLKRQVAVKRIKAQANLSSSLVRRFLTEAQSIAQINHPHIVQIFDFGEDTLGPFLILEYVEGGTLSDLLRNGPLEPVRAIEMTRQIADGLGKAHEIDEIDQKMVRASTRLIALKHDGAKKVVQRFMSKLYSDLRIAIHIHSELYGVRVSKIAGEPIFR